MKVHTPNYFDYDAEFNNCFTLLKKCSKKYNNFTLFNIEKMLSLSNMYSFVYKTFERYYNGTLAQNYINALNSIDFPFDFGLVPTSNFSKEDFWFGYKFAKEYFDYFQTFKFDENLIHDGFELGKWYSIVDQQSFISNISSFLLDTIQFNSKKQKTLSNKWISMFAVASKYRATFGHIVPSTKFIFEGKELGAWILAQRNAYKRNTLSKTAIALLEAIDFQWINPKNHKEIYCLGVVREYYNTNGSLDKPYVNLEVATSISYLASLKKKNVLTPAFENELVSYSKIWDEDAASYLFYAQDLEAHPNFFNEGYTYLEDAFQRYGYPLLLDSYHRRWAERICTLHKYHILKKEEYAQLQLINFDFDFSELCWRTGMFFLEQFIADGEDIFSYFNNNRSYKNYGISFWLNTQAKIFNDGKLTPSRLSELEVLGIDLKKLLISRDIHHHFECIKEYLTTGHITSKDFTIDESFDIIKDAKRRGILHYETISELNALGFNW